MSKIERVTPEETLQKIRAGKALLVCAYKDIAKFRMMQLKGAISWDNFVSKLDSLPKNQEVIFYCAWPQENSAASLAEEYIEKGYENAKCLGGGVEGWKTAGYQLESA